MKKILLVLISVFLLFSSVNAAEGDYIIKYREGTLMFYNSRSDKSLGAGMFLVDKDRAMALKDAGLLEICEPDSVMTYYGDPNDTYYSTQWNLPIIKSSYPWSLKTFGNNVLVGIIDSGLCPNHPDIDYHRVESGYNFGAIGSDSDYNTNRLDTTDIKGHGTAVSGIIVAKRNNSVGLTGISDKVTLLPMKVENKLGTIYTSSVINAINAGAGYGCDIINISLGQKTPDEGLELAIKNALDLGCIVVAAVGNNVSADPGNHLRYPAAYPGVISVGSVTKDFARAQTSVTNESVFVCAPAEEIPLLWNNGDYVSASGTSFAAPQVAAAAAIAKSINPDLTPGQFADILKNTAFRPDADGMGIPVRDNEIGYGILDIEAMVKYMLSGRKTYVSPIDETGTATIFNLTDSEIKLSSIFAAYSEGVMADYSEEPITIGAGGFYPHTFTTTASYSKIRHFLWNSLESVTPYESGYTPRELIK